MEKKNVIDTEKVMERGASLCLPPAPETDTETATQQQLPWCAAGRNPAQN